MAKTKELYGQDGTSILHQATTSGSYQQFFSDDRLVGMLRPKAYSLRFNTGTFLCIYRSGLHRFEYATNEFIS